MSMKESLSLNSLNLDNKTVNERPSPPELLDPPTPIGYGLTLTVRVPTLGGVESLQRALVSMVPLTGQKECQLEIPSITPNATLLSLSWVGMTRETAFSTLRRLCGIVQQSSTSSLTASAGMSDNPSNKYSMNTPDRHPSER